jgi:hypothetical protein
MMHEPLILAKLLVLFVGLFIAYQAYRGYVRNGSEPMLYLAVGFAFISVGAMIEGLLFELINLDIFLADAIQTVITAIGMLVVLYSLYGSHTTSLTKDS